MCVKIGALSEMNSSCKLNQDETNGLSFFSDPRFKGEMMM